MSDDTRDPQATNPHAGQPLPSDPAPRPPGGVGEPGSSPTGGPSVAPGAASGGPNPGAPTQQELAIRSALETVMDPELGLSVIDLGLIREVHVHPGRTAIKMMLTTPFCPYAPQMIADVKQAAQSVVPQECDVDVLPDPWSPDLMPDPGLLGYSF